MPQTGTSGGGSGGALSLSQTAGASAPPVPPGGARILSGTNLLIGAGTLALVGIVAGGYYQNQNNRYAKAVAETTKSLDQVNQLLDENSKEIQNEWDPLDGVLQAAGALGGATKQIAYLAGQEKHLIDANNAATEGDNLEIAKQMYQIAADAFQNVAEELASQGVHIAEKDVAGYGLLANSLARTGALLTFRNNLRQMQDDLESKLDTATTRYASQADYTDFSDIQKAFMQARDAFLAAQGKSRQQELQMQLADAASKSPGEPFQVATGLTIIDPDQGIADLNSLPQINPDFIAALKCENATFSAVFNGGAPVGHDSCNRYADGSYIPAFLPAQQTARTSSGTGRTGPTLSPSFPSTSGPVDLTGIWVSRILDFDQAIGMQLRSTSRWELRRAAGNTYIAKYLDCVGNQCIQLIKDDQTLTVSNGQVIFAGDTEHSARIVNPDLIQGRSPSGSVTFTREIAQ